MFWRRGVGVQGVPALIGPVCMGLSGPCSVRSLNEFTKAPKFNKRSYSMVLTVPDSEEPAHHYQHLSVHQSPFQVASSRVVAHMHLHSRLLE